MRKLEYNSVMAQLGLSTHDRQLVRRKTKYPHHFTEANGIVYITKEFADFIKACKWTQSESHLLQKKEVANG